MTHFLETHRNNVLENFEPPSTSTSRLPILKCSPQGIVTFPLLPLVESGSTVPSLARPTRPCTSTNDRKLPHSQIARTNTQRNRRTAQPIVVHPESLSVERILVGPSAAVMPSLYAARHRSICGGDHNPDGLRDGAKQGCRTRNQNPISGDDDGVTDNRSPIERRDYS